MPSETSRIHQLIPSRCCCAPPRRCAAASPSPAARGCGASTRARGPIEMAEGRHARLLPESRPIRGDRAHEGLGSHTHHAGRRGRGGHAELRSTVAVGRSAAARAVPTTITAVVRSDTVNVVRFQPQGLQFDRPASLTMSYANCGLLGSLGPKEIAHTTDRLEILSYLPSVDAPAARTVTGQLQHFSDYAIAW